MFVKCSQLKIAEHLLYIGYLFPLNWSNWYRHSGGAGDARGLPITPTLPERRGGLPPPVLRTTLLAIGQRKGRKNK